MRWLSLGQADDEVELIIHPAVHCWAYSHVCLLLVMLRRLHPTTAYSRVEISWREPSATLGRHNLSRYTLHGRPGSAGRQYTGHSCRLLSGRPACSPRIPGPSCAGKAAVYVLGRLAPRMRCSRQHHTAAETVSMTPWRALN
jgi:hypothetical protein